MDLAGFSQGMSHLPRFFRFLRLLPYAVLPLFPALALSQGWDTCTRAVDPGPMPASCDACTADGSNGCKCVTSCSVGWGSDVQNYVLTSDLTSGTGDCLRPNVDNIRIYGNGHRITTNGARAVVIMDRSGISVRNLTSDSPIQIYGADADTNYIGYVDLVDGAGVPKAGMEIFMGNNNTIEHSKMRSITNSDLAFAVDAANCIYTTHPTTCTTFSDNLVQAQVSDYADMADFMGEDIRLCVPQPVSCPVTKWIISGNTFINPAGTTYDVPNALKIHCARDNRIIGNTIRATDLATGLYIRDQADNSLYQDNTFWTSSAAAVRIANGNDNKCCAAGNLFVHNFIRAEHVGALYLEGPGTANTFLNNVIWSGGPQEMIYGPHSSGFDRNTFYEDYTGLPFYLQYRVADTDTLSNNVISYNSGDGTIFSFDGASGSVLSICNLYFNRAIGGTVNLPSSMFSDQNSILDINPALQNISACDFRATVDPRNTGSCPTPLGADWTGIPNAGGCYEPSSPFAGSPPPATGTPTPTPTPTSSSGSPSSAGDLGVSSGCAAGESASGLIFCLAVLPWALRRIRPTVRGRQQPNPGAWV
jgi:hypothetical protein